MAKDDFSEDHYACGPEVTDWDTPVGTRWANKARQTFEWRGREIGWMRMTNTPRTASLNSPCPEPTVKQSQIGGTHYKDMAIQPFEYIHKNNLGYLEGTAVKYVSRWRSKGGIEDLEKAIHALQYLIELEKGGA